MARTRDYYRVLGISRTASRDEMKRAYKRQLFARHPDRNLGDLDAQTCFMQVVRVYEVLSDPEARRSYDVYGAVAVDDRTARVWQQGTNNPNGWRALTGEVPPPPRESTPPLPPLRTPKVTKPKRRGVDWGTVLKAGAAVGGAILLAKRFAPYDESVRRHRGSNGQFRKGWIR